MEGVMARDEYRTTEFLPMSIVDVAVFRDLFDGSNINLNCRGMEKAYVTQGNHTICIIHTDFGVFVGTTVYTPHEGHLYDEGEGRRIALRRAFRNMVKEAVAESEEWNDYTEDCG